MPIYRFADPSGKIHEIEGPDGSTPEQAFQILSSRFLGAIPGAEGESLRVDQLKREQGDKSLGTKIKENLIGAGETALSLGSGMLSGIQAPIAAGIKRLTGMTNDWEKETNRIMSEQVYTPRTAAGQEMAEKAGAFVNDVLAPLGPGNLTGLAQAKLTQPRLKSGPAPETIKPPVAQPKPQVKPVDPGLELAKLRAIDEAQVARLEAAIAKQNPTQPTMFGNTRGEVLTPDNMLVENTIRAQDQRKTMAEAADAILADRQKALEAEMAQRVALEQQAALRARQEQAGTGFNEWNANRMVDEATASAEQLRALNERGQQMAIVEDFGNNNPVDTMPSMRVDENGMPIRADLSMEAQNLQNPLQRNLWGDELPVETGDGGVPLTQALDSMPPGAGRSEAISQLSGVRKFGQGGGIDPKVFEDLYNFGKSVVRGADGLLQPLYHGTTRAFSSIKSSKEGGALGNGVYMAVRPEYASLYANEPGGNIHQVYANITNPLVIKGPGDPMINALVSLGKTREAATRIVEKAYDTKGYITNEVRNLATKAGYDGIFQYRGEQLSEVVAFSEAQVKNAISGDVSGQRISRFGQGGGISPELLTLGLDKFAGKVKTHLIDPIVNKIDNLGRNQPVIKEASDFIASLPGMREKADTLITRPKAAAEMLADIQAQPDGPHLFENLQSGPRMSAEKSNSLLLRNSAQWLQWGKRKSLYLDRYVVRPMETIMSKLNTKELETMMTTFKDEMFGRKLMSPEELAALPPKVQQAYRSLRDSYDFVYNLQNEWREKNGKPPITKQEAYMASIFHGDYHVPVYSSDGKKLLWYIQTPTSRQAKSAIEWLKTQNLDIDTKKLDYKYKPSGSLGDAPRDMLSSWRDLVEVMGDDPRAQALKSAMEEWVDASGIKYLRQDLHQVNIKTNVRGFMGDQPWKDSKTNARDWGEAQIEYLRKATKWAPMQEVIDNLKVYIADPVIQENQKNNLNMMKVNLLQHTGVYNNVFKQFAQMMAGATGLPTNLARDVVNNVKGIVYLTTLAGSPGYIVATPMQALAGSMAYLTKEVQAGNLTPLDAKTFITSQFDAMQHGWGKHTFNNKLREKALQWADDNGVISTKIFDENKSLGANKILTKLEAASDWTISKPDQFARRQVFLPFAEALWKSGKYETMEAAFQRASEITDNIMVSMHREDRPALVGKFGALGDMMYVYKAPVFNLYNHLSIFGREAAKGNVAPLAAYLGVMALMGGWTAVPLAQELVKGFEMFKELLAETMPDQYEKIKDINPRISMLKLAPEMETFNNIVNYGLASTALGTNMSTRFNTELLDVEKPLTSLLGPGIEKVAEIGGNAAKALISPNQNSLTQAAYSMAPGPMARGLMENTMPAFKAKGQPLAEQDVTLFKNPRKLSDPSGYVYRDQNERLYKGLGLTALGEADRRQKDFLVNKEGRLANAAKKESLDKMFSAMGRDDQEAVKKYAGTFVRLSKGDMGALERELTQAAMKMNMTPQQYMQMNAKSLATMSQIQMRKELDRK